MVQDLKPFLSALPKATLVNRFELPFDNAIATARTCYSSKGIIGADQVTHWPRRDELAASLYQAGHHTVFQHAHFQFALENVSRQFVWSFLHSHPYYNSEQVSQRYVEVKPGTYTIPPIEGGAREIYERTVEAQFAAYSKLNMLLLPSVSNAYFERFKGRISKKDTKEIQGDLKKKTQEIARYVLPVATFTYLYHTISGITLLRYYRLSRELDSTTEQAVVIGQMIEELLKVAPEYKALLEDPIPLEQTMEYQFFQQRNGTGRAINKQFRREFDADLGNRVSLLVDFKNNNEKVLADAVREVLGASRGELSDDEAIEMVLNPAKNRILGENMNVTSLDKLSRAMVHPNYTFRKKLSHTADSQDQRHRMTPASRPCLQSYLTEEPDFVYPEIVKLDPQVKETYDEAMRISWQGINELRNLGVSDEFAAYLLPNAVSIRFTESADLQSLWHKLAMRLCYNAQEEIWRASKDEAEQIRQINPRIGKFLLPPCGLRSLSGQRPICPEGDRYCGVPVWKLDLPAYHRVI